MRIYGKEKRESYSHLNLPFHNLVQELEVGID